MEKNFEKIGRAIGIVISIGLAIVFFALIFGLPVMYLWNWLMVDLFHLPRINFYQSFGLYILCDFLFKKNELYNNSN
jgi:hypothetical protein